MSRLAYIISNDDLTIKDVVEFDSYRFETDIDFVNKSTVTCSRKPIVSTGDYVICKTENDKFFGICYTCDGENGSTLHTLTMKQIQCMFDQKIELTNEEIISTVGIEDFIKKTIESNFKDAGDTLINKSYINVTCDTHTLIKAKVSTENGIYNLKTYLGNAMQYYGIFLDFSIADGKLNIVISKKTQSALNIDTTFSDISNFTETYEVDILSKLKVIWKIPDTEDENGNTIVGAKSYKYYYLLNDRTITTDGTNVNRAKGNIDTVYIEAETEEEVNQEAKNQFTSNKYNHAIECDIYNKSKIYDMEDFYVGHECKVKSKEYGIKDSIITSVTRSNSAVFHIKLGNLKITLIEKLREVSK